MQHRPFACAMVFAAAGLLSACGIPAGASGGGTGGARGSTPATTTVTVTVTATTAPPTGAAMVPTDPQAYGQAFVTAWVDRDRARATVLGSPSAVSTAFGSTAPTPTKAPTFQDCGGAAGSSYCTWHGTSYTLVVQVGNERVAEHQDQAVVGVRFSH